VLSTPKRFVQLQCTAGPACVTGLHFDTSVVLVVRSGDDDRRAICAVVGQWLIGWNLTAFFTQTWQPCAVVDRRHWLGRASPKWPLFYVELDVNAFIANSQRPTWLNSTVELCGVGRCELAITQSTDRSVAGS